MKRTLYEGIQLKENYHKVFTQRRVDKGLTYRQIEKITGISGIKFNAIDLNKIGEFSLYDLITYFWVLGNNIKPSEIFVEGDNFI